jgi:hypothetical protein
MRSQKINRSLYDGIPYYGILYSSELNLSILMKILLFERFLAGDLLPPQISCFYGTAY